MDLFRNKSGKLPILTIIIAAVVLVGGLAVVKIMKPAKKGGKHEKKHVELTLWKMDEFTVNLADKGEAHYLKVNLVAEIEGKLEAEKGGDGGEGEANPLQIKASDAVISVLCKKYFTELLTEEGKEKLKSDLIKELNKSVPGVKVANIYFTSFAMQ